MNIAKAARDLVVFVIAIAGIVLIVVSGKWMGLAGIMLCISAGMIEDYYDKKAKASGAKGGEVAS